MANVIEENKNEAHYTPDKLIKEMGDILNKYYDGEIIEFLENSAGDGRIIDTLYNLYPEKSVLAYDIENRLNRSDIKTCNYLKEKIGYKKGRVCIMNPPFQKGIKFLYKSLSECDYVVSIMAANSLLNIDYDKVWMDEIQLYKNYDFITCKTDIIIVACRNKKEGDKYEY